MVGFASSMVGPVPGSRGGSVAPGRLLLSGAEFWVDAALSGRSGGKLLNLGTGGSALDATFGSTTGTDANDPADLTWSGTNYLYCPGAGNEWSTPTSSFLNITGDFEIVRRVAFDDWTPGTNMGMAGRDNADPNRAWYFLVKTTGVLSFRWFPTGSAASSISADSTVVMPATDGGTYWVKATLDVDNGAGGWTVRFWYAADQTTEPTVWTQLGADVSGAGVTSLPSVTASLNAGSAAGSPTNRDYRCIIRNGIGGAIVFDADFTRGITSGAQTTFTESSANAATVSINRASSGRKAVAVVRPTVMLGTDDGLEVANNALLNFNASQDFTVLAVLREWNTPTSTAHIVSKNNDASTGALWRLGHPGSATAQPRGVIGDGTNVASNTALAGTIGALQLYGFTVNRTSQLLTPYLNASNGATASTATVGDLTNALPMRIGVPADLFGNKPLEGELFAAAVFRRALTTTEIAAIVAFYGAS